MTADALVQVARWALLLCFTAVLTLAPAGAADAKTSVGSTYAQVGTRTLSVYAMVDGAPKNARIILETKRFSKTRKGKARRTVRKLSRSGRITLKVAAPRGAKKITARVRVYTRTKRRGKTRTKSVAKGQWKTVTFARGGRLATVAKVKAAEVSSVAAPSSTAPGSLLLTGSSTKAAPGQIIATGITPQTPDGLFAQITQVTPAPGGVAATVVQARLSDVVPAGEFDLDIPIEPVATISGKTTSEKKAHALQCDTSRTAAASALAEVSAGLSLSAKWTGGSFIPPRVPQLTADLTGKVQARLEGEIALSGQAKCSLTPQTLFPTPVRLAAFTVQVGPVPVPVIIDGQVTLTGSAEATGSLATSVKAGATAEAGVTYKAGKLTPRKSFARNFNFQPPTVTGTGLAQVALSPSIGVRLAGAAGPEIDLTGGLKLAGNLRATPGQPWWALTAPMSLGAKFKFALWGVEAESPRYELWSEEPILAQADPATGAPGSTISAPSPSPEPLPAGVRTRLTWDSNTDVDLHTWNQYGDHAYFNDMRAIEGGYLDQDIIPGYGPETFFETDPSLGNEFTFGVCQYSGENATVTIDIRDPDGNTRRYTIALRGRKAAALLATSPDGITPYIDQAASWCSRGTDPLGLGQATTGTFG